VEASKVMQAYVCLGLYECVYVYVYVCVCVYVCACACEPLHDAEHGAGHSQTRLKRAMVMGSQSMMPTITDAPKTGIIIFWKQCGIPGDRPANLDGLQCLYYIKQPTEP
jgi:hypothetical protein